jgi:SAM-dependent methyltransferase
MKQSEIFLEGEGDQWLKRNIKKIGKRPDPILDAIHQYKIQPKLVLEVGCANGWRLDLIRDLYGCHVSGIDPGDFRNEGISYGTADDLGRWADQVFNVVIYGWCLYLCDPEDYFRIAAEGDRVLADGGFIIIHDFSSEIPYKVPYKHKKGVFSHHYNFAKLWLSHPAYHLYGRTYQDETTVTILKKNMNNAFPVEK